MSCEICDTPWPELGSFRHWRITVARDQYYLGKCIIALRRHEEDFLALKAEERDEMWRAGAAGPAAPTPRFPPGPLNYPVPRDPVRPLPNQPPPPLTSPP